MAGPDADGFSISFRFREGRYHEALGRPSEPLLDKSKARKKGPVFVASALTQFPDEGGYIATDIEFGEKADLELVSKIYKHVHKKIVAAFTRKESPITGH